MTFFLWILGIWLGLGICIHFFRCIFRLIDGMRPSHIWYEFIPESMQFLLIRLFLKRFKNITLNNTDYKLTRISHGSGISYLVYSSENDTIQTPSSSSLRETLLSAIEFFDRVQDKQSSGHEAIEHDYSYFQSKI